MKVVWKILQSAVNSQGINTQINLPCVSWAAVAMYAFIMWQMWSNVMRPALKVSPKVALLHVWYKLRIYMSNKNSTEVWQPDHYWDLSQIILWYHLNLLWVIFLLPATVFHQDIQMTLCLNLLEWGAWGHSKLLVSFSQSIVWFVGTKATSF